MSVQKEQALSRAFELIEADQLEEARAILKPILDTDKDNPDVWWLYAHAVTDPETARLALSNVRRLDPEYLNAGELLYSLESQAPGQGQSDISSEKEPSFLPAVPPTLPGLPGSQSDLDEDDWEMADDEDEEAYTPIYRRPIFLLALGTIIFAIIATFVILQPPPQNTGIVATATLGNVVVEVPTIEPFPATATIENAVVDAPTIETLPTVETEATLTGEPEVTSERETNGERFSDLYAALSDFDVADNSITVEQTTLGDTVVIPVCTEAGATLRETLPKVLKATAQAVSTFSTEAQAIAARMIDCGMDSTLLMIGAIVSDAQAYADGSMSEEAFQATWQPIG